MLFSREAFANQESRGEQKLKLEVFDPPTCCSSGVCGATPSEGELAVLAGVDGGNNATS